jgi:hypothetical protein
MGHLDRTIIEEAAIGTAVGTAMYVLIKWLVGRTLLLLGALVRSGLERYIRRLIEQLPSMERDRLADLRASSSWLDKLELLFRVFLLRSRTCATRVDKRRARRRARARMILREPEILYMRVATAARRHPRAALVVLLVLLILLAAGLIAAGCSGNLDAYPAVRCAYAIAATTLALGHARRRGEQRKRLPGASAWSRARVISAA